MDVSPVDPRTALWEVDRPSYRVDLWWPISGNGWRSDEYALEDVTDVDEVQRWADRQGAPVIVVYVRHVRDNGEPGLIRLLGREPTR